MTQYEDVQCDSTLGEQKGDRWRLRLFGKFSLQNPSGQIVNLEDRKTEGLLAILTLNREFGIERQLAAEILWPFRAPKNLANLRRSLSILRRELGSSSIESSVQHCRLASHFVFDSDLDNPEARNGGFMPGHEGDWFEDARLETLELDLGDGDKPTVVGHFIETLRWFAEHDPRGMYLLLGALPSMGRSIPYSELFQLIEMQKPHDTNQGWYSYWRGTVEDDLEQCVGHLRSALRFAKLNEDMPLASEACLELGKAYARTGKLEKALKLCDAADQIALRTNLRTTKTNAKRLRATVLMNWLDSAKGLQLFHEAEKSIDDPIEFAFTQNARAFFEASLGLYDRAEVTLNQGLTTSRSLGHFRIGVVSSFTRTILQAVGGSRSGAVDDLQKQAEAYFAAGVTQFGVYAEELAAKLYLIDGDKASAASCLKSARTGRLSAQMTVTPLEAKRVAVIVRA